MKADIKRLIKRTTLFPLFWLFANLPCESPSALAAISSPRPHTPHNRASNRQAALERILSVLEVKMGEQSVPDKVRHKLLVLSDGQIRLITSLSDRINDEGRTAGADIAFLLITALIIFS
jgi:hypothetical protein